MFRSAPSALRAVRGAALLVVLLLGLSTAGATAATTHPLIGSFGSFANPQGIGVDQASGDVYVIDVGSGTVSKFDATGAPRDFSGPGTNTIGGFSFDSPDAAQVAIDSSGGVANGDIYVTDLSGVHVYGADGTHLGDLTDTPNGPNGEACGVAVDGAGNLYVGDFNGAVHKYTPTTNPPTTGDWVADVQTPRQCEVAVDAGGNVYANEWTSPVHKFDSSGLYQYDVDPNAVLGVAADPVGGHVLVAEADHVAEYDVSSPLGPSLVVGFGSFGSTGGVGVNGTTGDVYVSDSGAGTVERFGPLTMLPDVTDESVSDNDTGTTATLNGVVNPVGTSTHWQFEYGTDTGYGSVVPASPGDAGSGSSDVPVTEPVTGLHPGTTYHFRLNATNADGTTHGSDMTFTTPSPPSIDEESVSQVHATSATLNAKVDPNGFATAYHFEYGLTSSYGSRVPAPDAAIGNGSAPVSLDQGIAGLEPGTTYHYRVVATSGIGSTSGPDHVLHTPAQGASGGPDSCPNAQFRTGPSAALPDCRAYEMVSPPDKQGGDVIAYSDRTRAARDGSAVGFVSLRALPDAAGTGVGVDYLSQRDSSATPGTNGWTTHALTPAQAPLSLFAAARGLEPAYQGDFSDDLSHGVFRAWTPLTDAPMVRDVVNLYARHDLRSAQGAYSLLSDCPACTSPLPASALINTSNVPRVAGASADFSRVLFESGLQLTSDAPASGTQLYESDGTSVRLAGILPDGTPAPQSIAGQGATDLTYTPHVISADGSRVFFTVPQRGSCGGYTCGQLYMRTGDATVHLNASEVTGVADPDAVGSATYWDATPNGSRVFFTTADALTDDAPINNDRKVYMYDATKPHSDAHNLMLVSKGDNSADVDGVLGVGGDGHDVYFSAYGPLMSGQPPVAGLAIYLWSDTMGTPELPSCRQPRQSR